ncbi:excalibur calcium-binding domain-containing protein [Prochlorococcus sp. MIT 1303]
MQELVAKGLRRGWQGHTYLDRDKDGEACESIK